MASTIPPSSVGSGLGVNCDDLVRAAFVCIQVTDPTQCSCFGPDPTSFMTNFEDSTRQAFMSTMAFADPTAPNYCDIANEKVCENYEATQSCCCTPETEEARKCLVENVLSNEVPFPLAAPCTGVCASAEEGGGGGSTLIIGAVAAVVAILLIGGGYYWWRRRNRVQAENSDDMKKDGKDAKDVRSSGGTSTEDEKGMDADIEKGDASSFKSDSSSSSSSSSSSEESSHPKSKQQPPRPPPQVMTKQEEDKNKSPSKERDSRERGRHSDRSEGSRERDEGRRRERDHREKQSDRSEWPPNEGRYDDRDRGHRQGDRPDRPPSYDGRPEDRDRGYRQGDRPDRPPSYEGRPEDRDRDYRQGDRPERRPSYEGRYEDRDRDYRRENHNDRLERPKCEGRYDDRDRSMPARDVPSKASGHSRSSKAEDLRKKRQAIESWNSNKRQGSNRSLNSYVSGASSAYTEESVDSDGEGTMTSRRSDRKSASANRRTTPAILTQAPPPKSTTQAQGRSEAVMSSAAPAETKDELMKAMMAKLDETTAELNAKMEKYQHDLERVAVDKSISKKRVKALSEDREATTLRLNQLEEARSYHEGRLQAAEHEVEALRQERVEAAKRIADLEAQNAHLSAQLKRSAALSSAPPGEAIADIAKRSSSSRRRREKYGSGDLKRASSASSLIEGNGGEGRKSSSSGSRRRREKHEFGKSASSEDLSTSWNHNSIQSRSVQSNEG